MRRIGAVTEIAGLDVGDHICWAYSSNDEHRRVLTTYFSEGLAAGERLAFLAPEGTEKHVLDYLGDDGHDVDALLAEGRLVVGAAEEILTSGGKFDPDAGLGGFRALTAQALSDGCTGLRSGAEVGWLLDHPAARDLWPSFELRLDLLTALVPLTTLCCYDLRSCDPHAVGFIQAVHSLGLSTGEPGSVTGFHLHGNSDGSIGVSGKLDSMYSQEVGSILSAAAKDVSDPVLDLSKLSFADVSGMRAIATAARQMAALHDRVGILGASPMFRKRWSMLRFGDQIPTATLD